MAYRDGAFHLTDTEYNEGRERILKRSLNEKNISISDADLINKFIDSRNTSIHAKRKYKYTTILTGLRRNKFVETDYKNLTRADFDRAVSRIQDYDYSINTKRDYTDFLKRFTLWMIKKGYCKIEKGSDDASDIREMSPGPKDKMTKKIATIFTEDDINKMVQAADGPMWQCFIALMFDAALRPQEAGKLTWGQVSIEKNKAVINTAEKTGRPRRIPVYRAFPYLKAWANSYPKERKSDSYVFLNMYGQPFIYNSLRDHVKIIAKTAEVNKPIRLHTFRHAGITDMQRRGMNDTITQKIGWGGMSDQLETYSHLTDQNVDDAISESLGIKQHTPRPKALEQQLCPVCASLCKHSDSYCPDCGEPLSEAAISQGHGMKKSIAENMSDPEFRKALLEYLQNGK